MGGIMTIARITAMSLAAALSWLAGSSPSTAAPTSLVQGTAKYNFLRGSKWYVPTQTLPAVEMILKTGHVRNLVDQTVWDITNYRDGYFWGNTVAVFTSASTGQPTGDPSCSRMIGSPTPDGQVQITFIGADQTTAIGAVRGAGTLTRNPGQDWMFDMQMSTGTSSIIVHSSFMKQCKTGDDCQTKLPGSELSLSDFLA
jgi:hypothetical protein